MQVEAGQLHRGCNCILVNNNELKVDQICFKPRVDYIWHVKNGWSSRLVDGRCPLRRRFRRRGRRTASLSIGGCIHGVGWLIL